MGIVTNSYSYMMNLYPYIQPTFANKIDEQKLWNKCCNL